MRERENTAGHRAPPWALMPVWSREPKKRWDRQEQRQYDWRRVRSGGAGS